MDDTEFQKEIAEFVAWLIEGQEPLGAQFADALEASRDELYET